MTPSGFSFRLRARLAPARASHAETTSPSQALTCAKGRRAVSFAEGGYL